MRFKFWSSEKPDGGSGAASRLLDAPLLFVLSYFVFLVLLAFYVEDLDNAMRVDPVRLYSYDTMWRLMFAQCLPAHPGLWNYVNPGPLYILSAAPVTLLFHSAGVSPITSVRLFNALLSLVTLLATRGILRKLNSGGGFTLLALAVIASNPLYLVDSIGTVETMMLVALVMTGVYFFYRRNFLIAAVLVSLSALVRVEGYPVAAAWTLYYLFRFRRGSLKYLVAAALPHLVYFLIYALAFGDPLYMIRYRAGIAQIQATYFTSPWNIASPVENFIRFVPGFIELHGVLFFALASAAFFTTLRRREFIPVNIVSGATLLYLALVLIFFKELSDRWTLVAAVAAAIPMVHLLRRLSARGERVSADAVRRRRFSMAVPSRSLLWVAVVLAAAMVAMNVANRGTEAYGDCCPNLGTYVPRQTMEWIRNYTENQGESPVYMDVGQRLIRLHLEDAECTLVQKDVRYLLGPGENCTYLIVSPAKMEYRLGFDKEGVVLTNVPLRCTPSDAEFIPMSSLPEDKVLIYRVRKT